MLRVSGVGFRGLGLGRRASGFGFRASGFGFQVWGFNVLDGRVDNLAGFGFCLEGSDGGDVLLHPHSDLQRDFVSRRFVGLSVEVTLDPHKELRRNV